MDFMFPLAREHLRILQEEFENVARESDAWVTLLNLLLL